MSIYGSIGENNSATLVPELTPADALPKGPCCSNCDAPMASGQMVCRRCGLYPSLGIFVDVDDEWEQWASPELATPKPRRNPVEECFAAVPLWAWTLLATNLTIVGLCVAGKLLLPANSVIFEFWGVWQLTLGLALFEILHITCFFMTATEDASMTLIDFIVNPMKAWFKTFARLPRRQWLVMGASNSITLAITAALVVGGIQWDRLWDWGIAPPAKSSLLSAVASAAANVPTNGKNLEESVKDFAGTAEGLEEGSADKKQSTPKAAERLKTDCLIVGFELNDLEQVAKLYLAHESKGRLVYAGSIMPKLDAEKAKLLKAKLLLARTSVPIVKVNMAATWVKPRFPCRVSYTVEAPNGMLRNMELDELLPEINVPW